MGVRKEIALFERIHRPLPRLVVMIYCSIDWDRENIRTRMATLSIDRRPHVDAYAFPEWLETLLEDDSGRMVSFFDRVEMLCF